MSVLTGASCNLPKFAHLETVIVERGYPAFYEVWSIEEVFPIPIIKKGTSQIIGYTFNYALTQSNELKVITSSCSESEIVA